MFTELLLPRSGGRIRCHQESDLEAMVRCANNPKVSRYLKDRFPCLYTEAHGREYLQFVTNSPKRTSFVIELDGEFAGGIAHEPKSDVYRLTTAIGYWLGESFWGRGVATEAVTVFSNALLETGEFIRLEADVYAPNIPSALVLKKAGFKLEARRRSTVIKHGVIMDSMHFAKVRG